MPSDLSPFLGRIPMRIYIASKACHRPLWREFREAGHNIISRWIDVPDKYSEDPEGLDFTQLWQWCVEDVISCDALVCHVEPGEVLKGAILEVGVALAHNKRVILLGPRREYLNNGTWINHPGIEHWEHFRIGEVLHRLHSL